MRTAALSVKDRTMQTFSDESKTTGQTEERESSPNKLGQIRVLQLTGKRMHTLKGDSRPLHQR
jgi:hypothetical protein